MINVGANMKEFKKVFSSVLGIIMGVSTLSFSGCGDNGFAGVNTDDEIYAALAEATEDYHKNRIYCRKKWEANR